jgi:ABC-type uncharacterized transport system substrate-binding protein
MIAKMKRREFITLLGGAAVAWPLTARAQTSGKTYRIGFLGVFSYAEYRRQVDALLMGLRQLGYDEGKNIVIHYRWAEGKYDRLPELASELAKLNVDVIVTHSTPGSRAAKEATSTIPIVMAAVIDPVEMGLVPSLHRPGGNLTGLTFFVFELYAKRVELIREAIPTLMRAAVLINPANPAQFMGVPVMQRTASALGVELVLLEVKTRDDIAPAVATATRRAQALTSDYFQRQTDCRDRAAEQTADDWVQASGRSWRADGIWSGSCGPLFPRGDFRRQDTEGHLAGGPAGRAGRQIRVHRQPQDRQGARPRSANVHIAACH